MARSHRGSLPQPDEVRALAGRRGSSTCDFVAPLIVVEGPQPMFNRMFANVEVMQRGALHAAARLLATPPKTPMRVPLAALIEGDGLEADDADDTGSIDCGNTDISALSMQSAGTADGESTTSVSDGKRPHDMYVPRAPRRVGPGATPNAPRGGARHDERDVSTTSPVHYRVESCPACRIGGLHFAIPLAPRRFDPSVMMSSTCGEGNCDGCGECDKDASAAQKRGSRWWSNKRRLSRSGDTNGADGGNCDGSGAGSGARNEDDDEAEVDSSDSNDEDGAAGDGKSKKKRKALGAGSRGADKRKARLQLDENGEVVDVEMQGLVRAAASKKQKKKASSWTKEEKERRERRRAEHRAGGDLPDEWEVTRGERKDDGAENDEESATRQIDPAAHEVDWATSLWFMMSVSQAEVEWNIHKTVTANTEQDNDDGGGA